MQRHKNFALLVLLLIVHISGSAQTRDIDAQIDTTHKDLKHRYSRPNLTTTEILRKMYFCLSPFPTVKLTFLNPSTELSICNE